MAKESRDKINPKDLEQGSPKEILGLNLDELDAVDAAAQEEQKGTTEKARAEAEEKSRLGGLAEQVEKLREHAEKYDSKSPAISIIEKRISGLLTENLGLAELLEKREQEKQAYVRRDEELAQTGKAQEADKVKRTEKEKQDERYRRLSEKINAGRYFGDFGTCLTEAENLGALRGLDEAQKQEVAKEKLGYKTLGYKSEKFAPASFMLPSERKKAGKIKKTEAQELQEEREKGIFQLLQGLKEKAVKSIGEKEKTEKAEKDFLKKLKEGQNVTSLEGLFSGKPAIDRPSKFVLSGVRTSKEVRGKYNELKRIPYEGALVLEVTATKRGGKALNVSVPKEIGNLSQFLGEKPTQGTNLDLSGAPQKLREIIEKALAEEKKAKAAEEGKRAKTEVVGKETKTNAA